MEHRTRLKQLLDDNGIKQSWLAAKANVSTSTLNTIVNGKNLPTLRIAQKIARALDTTVDYLWPLEDEDVDGTT
jgi:putative transcriptional regulator